ncbi:DUF4143 domain-containing protein [Geoglobus acetivorans]|uniref:ATP-binding protein n=1 Tax=Geoglobus acetivorans TaxID=565033 RepID=A0ABZ3H6W6_GEOAI|nr:ATP-binding protein [Geoglobus acetivorans]
MEYYPRIIELEMEKWLKRREVILLKGPRQAGKTTLFVHLMEKLNGDYVTLEDEEMLRAFEKNPKMFVKRFGKTLFIDEAQYCKKAGKVIKLLFDLYPDLKLFVTGSGSFDIKVEVGKYLVGRAVYFELFPLNFEEFLIWKAKDLVGIFREYRKMLFDFIRGEDVHPETSFESEFGELLGEYVVFGGFPAVVKEEDYQIKKALLKNLYKTYLEKDVFFFLNVRHLEKFRDLMKALSFMTGDMLRYSSLSSDLKMDYKTLENYISILVNTYVIELVPPFHRNLVTEIKKAKKVYFVDTGLRNAILGDFSPLAQRTDKGKLLENFVVNEIKKYGEVRYWRTTGKAEVDFVLNFEGRIVPVEVKSFGKVRRSFLSFLSTYRPERAVVFTENDSGVKRVGSTDVLFVPHWFV